MSPLDDTEHILAGHWIKDESTIRGHIWKTLRQIQEDHREDLIYFDLSEWDESQMHIITVDTVGYTIEEQRSDPVGEFKRWYGSGCEVRNGILPLCLDRVRIIFALTKTLVTLSSTNV